MAETEYREEDCPLYNDIPRDCYSCHFFQREWHKGVLCRCIKDTCSICGRDNISMTKHHLNPDNKNGLITFVCRPCHNQIHAVFKNYELKQEYNTPKKIRKADRMKEFIEWIKNTDKDKIQINESKKVRKWRR